jgi:hypothetical protein
MGSLSVKEGVGRGVLQINKDTGERVFVFAAREPNICSACKEELSAVVYVCELCSMPYCYDCARRGVKGVCSHLENDIEYVKARVR